MGCYLSTILNIGREDIETNIWRKQGTVQIDHIHASILHTIYIMDIARVIFKGWINQEASLAPSTIN